MTTTYNKDGAYIEVTVDGVVHRRSIKWKDCVVSVPSGANLKIDLAYVNSSDQLVLVLEDESEIIMTALEDLDTHDTDIKALLATIAAYIDTEVAAIRDSIYEEHSQARILFITPEAVASISADNTAIKAVLEELGAVDHIVQTDALNYPNFTTYNLCVLGSNSDTPWTTANLADVKTVPLLPILCFDKIAAAYLEMGTATTDDTGATAIAVIDKIEGSVLGMGSYYKSIIGLAAGSNTISSSATYHGISMADTDLSEVIYATFTTNTNVVLGFLPGILENGAAGLDELGNELPATLAFFGAGYEAAKLNTLGLAVIYLVCRILIYVQTRPVEIVGTVQNLRKLIIGDMGWQFSNTAPLVEWIVGQNSAGTKLPYSTSLYDVLLAIIADTEDLQAILGTPANFMANVSALALEATLTAIKGGGWSTQTLVAIKAAIDAIPTVMVGTDGAALASAWTAALATALGNYTEARAGYLDQLDFALQEAIAAIPTTAMRGTDDAATEAKQDIIDTAVDGIKTQTDKIANKMLFTMDFWSASLEEVSLDGDAAATITLPTVTVADLPTNATITHAVVMFKFRMIENTHATIANKLDGATSAATSQVIQIDKSGATFIDAINFVDDQFGIAAATREGGDVIVGSIDVATEVDANDTYELRWLLALADEDLLNFNDVQVGIRVWYSV